MPLYQNATNLQGRGNFAPGVSYYAGIKAPTPAAPRIEKGSYNFNIDLAPIGNAMIAAKDSETKLAMSAMEMEQNQRNADLDRQLRLDIANMEDARMRDINRDKLAMDWQIAELNNATELEKLKYTKSKDAKDQTKALARLALSRDEELRDKYIDRVNGSVSELEYNTFLNKKINEISTATGSDPQDLYTVAASIGYTQGFGNELKAQEETAKKIREQQLTDDIALGGILNPSATAADKAATGAAFRQDLNNTSNLYKIANNTTGEYGPTAQAMGQRLFEQSADNLVTMSALNTMRTVQNNIPHSSNPTAFVETSKQALTDFLSQQTGVSYNDMRRRVDAVYALENVEGTLTNTLNMAQDNAQFQANVYNAYLNQSRFGAIKNSPMLRASVMFGNEYVAGLEGEERDAIYQVMGSHLIGNVTENYEWVDSDGEKHRGWRWQTAYGDDRKFENAEVDFISEKLGFSSPVAAVYWLAGQAMNAAADGIKKNTVLEEDASNVVNNAVSTISGNPNIDHSYNGLTPEQRVTISNNIHSACKTGTCDLTRLHTMSNNMQEGPRKQGIIDIENYLSGVYLLGEYLGGGSKKLKFQQAVEYISPNNLTLKEFNEAIGKPVEAGDDNSFKLKKSVQWYTIGKDGNVYIDFTERGLITSGEKQRQFASTYVRNTMKRAKLNTDQQVAVYKRYYPDMLPYDPGYGDGMLPSWMRDAYSIMQQETVENGAALDTQFASYVSKMADKTATTEPVIEQEKIPTAEEAFEMYMNRRSSEENKNEVEANGINMLTKEAEHIRSVEGWEDKSVDGIKYKTYTEDGVLHILIGNDTFAFEFPLNKTEEELVADLKNNPKETVETLNGSWSRIK